jgi:biopolymer transport protein ExbB
MNETIELLRQGGWPMIPLGICSLVGLAIILERFVSLRRHAVIDAEVEQMVDQFNGDSSADDAISKCRRARGPYARIIEEVLHARGHDRAYAIETMHSTGRAQLGYLERGLTVLEIIANISPLIGLLGTVLGMVTIFNAITTEGLGRPEVLSEGISKALITTVAGLCVAIPALAFHSWFSRRADDLAIEMQNRATGFVAKLWESHVD